MSRFSTIWCLVFLLLPLLSRGQQENLILNGSLEEYISCPYEPTITRAKHWSAGIPGGLSSTDYYHQCAATVPGNVSFHQEATHGEAYIGFGFLFNSIGSPSSGGREFASGRLKECLTYGKRYRLSFSVCIPYYYDFSPKGINCFEMYFHQTEYPFDASNSGISNRYPEVADRVISIEVTSPIVQQALWHRLSAEFVANGDECYFTVGCFQPVFAENIAQLDSILPGTTPFFGALYLYDDFVLTEIVEDTATPFEPVVPNVFTPNGDGINDYWVIENLPPGTDVAIYNRWGQQVYNSQHYNNDWGGEGLPAGNYIVELVFRDLPPRRLTIFLKR